MQSKYNASRIVIIGAAVLLATVASAQNLLQNGSFEEPDVPLFALYGSNDMFPGWTVKDTATGVSVIDNDYTGGGAIWQDTPAGHQFLYLNNNALTGAVEQSVALSQGTRATLSFLQADFASYYASGGGYVTVSVRDSQGGYALAPQSFTTPDLSGYLLRQLDFSVSRTDLYTLRFQATQGHGGLIDNVILTAIPVPEPASLAVLGLGAVALLRRRR